MRQITDPMSPDVVVVGCGIAGGALATVLARAGLGVLVLERQAAYRDRVRGENMAPWGVAEAQQIGIFEVFMEAGGHWARRIAAFGVAPPEQFEDGAGDIGAVIPDVPGMLNFPHPAACEALARAAEAAGARVERTVGDVRMTPGSRPEVRYARDGADVRVACRLVVGADGRQSAVRKQCGIALERLGEIHLIGGLLVEGAEEWPDDLNCLGAEGERTCLVFPLGRGRHRLYLCHSPKDRRFGGPHAAQRFLDAYRLDTLPQAACLAGARAAGPCAFFPGDDTWALVPFTEGVVLAGDAAGHNNPIVGQGLSLAVRDARILSELLLENHEWSPATFEPYAVERLERMRRVRFSAALAAELMATYGREAHARRARAFDRMAEQPELAAWRGSNIIGPHAVPAEAFDESVRERVLAP